MNKTYGGVRDLAILHGDIEVDTDENTLALEVKVSDGKLVGERHGMGGRSRKVVVWRKEKGPIDVDAVGI